MAGSNRNRGDSSNSQKDSARSPGIVVREPEAPAGEDRFRGALDAMGDGIWDWNLQTDEVFYSDRWLESLGYERSEVPPHFSFVDSIIHPDDKGVLTRVGTEHIEGRTDYFECEYRLRKNSGDYRWTLGRGRVLERDKNGQALRVLGVNFDITSGKAAELALEQAEQRCRTIVETAESVIICLDTDLRILEWNRAAETIYGWTRAEVQGKSYVEWFLPEEGRARADEELQNVLAGSRRENYEDLVITRDGSERLLLWNLSSLLDSEGKAWGLVGIAQDITEQRRAVRQRELAYREMEVLVERFEALRGLLRVCSVCKKIRDHRGNWLSLDEYLLITAEVKMTHGYCPTCLDRVTKAELPEADKHS